MTQWPTMMGWAAPAGNPLLEGKDLRQPNIPTGGLAALYLSKTLREKRKRKVIVIGVFCLRVIFVFFGWCIVIPNQEDNHMHTDTDRLSFPSPNCKDRVRTMLVYGHIVEVRCHGRLRGEVLVNPA